MPIVSLLMYSAFCILYMRCTAYGCTHTRRRARARARGAGRRTRHAMAMLNELVRQRRTVRRRVKTLWRLRHSVRAAWVEMPMQFRAPAAGAGTSAARILLLPVGPALRDGLHRSIWEPHVEFMNSAACGRRIRYGSWG